jgi:hypothetical protein
VRRRTPREPWLALALAIAIAAGLQFSTPNLIGNDSYFHIRYAQVVREAGVRGFPPPFPWLPLTILAPDRYADHHMLYHVLLTPFTLGDLRVGGKLAGLAGTVAFLIAFVVFLRRERVPLPGLALLALGASSADFLFRLSMTRVQALSLVCLLAGFHCALHRRHVLLAVVGCVYAWLYDGFPLLFLPVGATVLAEALLERRLRPGILIAALAGVTVGLVLNPYFPDYLQFIVHHMGDKLAPGEAVRVGREWFPYDPAGLLANASVAMLYVAFAIVVLVERGAERDRRAVAALLVAVVFLVLMLNAKRFIEYFAPFATLAAALAGASLLARLDRRRLIALGLVLAIVAGANAGGVAATLVRKRAETPADRYAAAARYVADTAPPGAMLCTADWDDFPWLFFHNTASTYLIGLDPTYLRDRDREAYWTWVDVSQGKVAEPSRVLASRFPCAYMLSDRDHTAFLEQAAHDPGLEEVLADDQMVLYRVRSSAGAAAGAVPVNLPPVSAPGDPAPAGS